MKVTFDTHPKSKFWSTKNKNVTPEECSLYSHKKYWFDCEECFHSFECSLNNINVGKWCSYCANKKLCGKCSICFNKSFASHIRSNNWSTKNQLETKLIFKLSHKEYTFDCECGHEFKTKLRNITHNNSWCPYCSIPSKKLCSNIQSCISCYNKTFALNNKSKYWSIKNVKKPIEVFKSTAEVFIFNCDKCYTEFKSKLCHITDGSWCPNCRYKTEEKIKNILFDIFPLIKTQVKYEWCKNVKHLPFDFVLEEQKIIIECDGEQHWKQIAKWKPPEDTRKRDIYKIKCANENGYSIIRILQKDIWNDRYDWLQELLENIDKIILDKRVQNIYMCKTDEYKDFDTIIDVQGAT
jgi:very-short-patch-repair endonuclease